MKKEYSLQIYKPNGENTDIELRKYQYNGSFMGERNITASISSPVKINWEIGDYVIFRNEPFTLRYVPPVKKQSRRGTYGEGYIYEGIVFSSIISQLIDVQFLDYVSNDNNIHYTGLSNFAFYVSNNSLTEFASRIKANIERVYGKDSWDVIVANKGVIIKDEDNNVIVEGSSFEFDDQSISITSGTSIYNAICLINTQLELNFLIRIVNGRKTIILGGSSVATAESLGYGKGRGLKSIQQSHNNNEQIVTRLHAYGSSRNLPYRYYNKKYNDKNKYPKMFDSNGNYLLESRYINKLMLPYKCWVQTSYLWDAFIQSKLADVIGIKEGEVTFDGSDEEWDEIYPSLEKQSVNDWKVGMTMYDSGYREYSETMRNRFLFNTRQMTSYGNTIEEIKKIFSLNTKNADDREQAKSILEDCKWTVTPGKEAYYEEAMKIIDEVWDGKDWDYKYDYAVQKTHKLSSTEKSNIKKYTYNGDGRLDRLPSGASIKDNGVSSDGSYTDGSTDTNGTIINTTFEVIIPQLGFDIEDWVSQDNSKATMSIKSGMCAGREFPINSCIAVDVNDYSKGWKLNLDRHQDMEVNMIFPNSVYKLSAGDEYVLTGIYMPDTYVESAENRLYEQAVKYLADIDHTKYTYNLDVDSKWMYEHEKVANLLYEGCSIVFNDFDSGDEMSGVGDLNIGEISVVATQVTISFNEESLPKYTIVLSDDKHTAVNLQEMISASVKSNTISYANSISLLEKKINDKLSKTEQDEAQELITFLKGIKTAGIENDGNNITKGLTKLYDAIMSNGFKNSMTAGSGWQIDKNGNAQVESIEVRSYMRVLELVMNRLSAEESEFIFTESGTVETATLNEDGTYTLVMRKKTDKDITAFQVDDVLKGVVNDLAEPGAVGVKYYTSWVQVKEVNQTTNSIKVAVYADNDTPAKKNFPPCNLMVLHRWGNTTKEERQSCWYISSIEKRIVMLDGVTQPKLVESNYASFYGLPFDMGNFKGYTLEKKQPYLYVRGAFLQDVCFIDYLGKVVKQERYRGVWSQEVANSDDPYIVTQTTFDTVYHNNAKWQCNSTEGTKEEPSVGTTDWTKLSEGGKGSDGKSAAKAYVTTNDIAIPTDANGIVTEDFQIGNTFSLKVDGKNCTDLQVTMDGTPATNAFQAQLNQLWLTISSSKGAEFGLLAYTLHFTVTGVLDNVTYSDVVTILVRPNRAGADGKNLTKVSNFYKWGASGTEVPGGDYTENNIPEHVEGLDYLWNYEVCYNNAGETISTSEKTCIGNFARGIASITEYYQIGTAEKPDKPISVDTIDASGWQTIMPPLTAEKRYLWNLEVVRFTDGTYSISEVHLAGAQGESITIEQKLVYYAISASGTSTPPDSWFSDTVKEPTIEKPYLWTCVSIRYSDTTVVKYYTVARRGENGAPGRNLTRVVNYYKWGTSGNEAPSGEYTPDAIPEHIKGFDYLWNYEVCYSDNDVLSQSGKACIGYFPKDGDPGKGIKSITEFYQVGTEEKPTNGITVNSNNELDTTGWKTSMDPTTNENRFVWNQEVIQFTDGTYSISVIHLAGAQGAQGDQGIKGEDGADGALPNLFGYDTKVECLVGHHNVVHTKTGFAVVLDSLSDDDTSSDRYCLLRIKDFTDGEGTYSVSGYITHSAGGKFEFDCGDVTPQTMYLTANKRTRFEKKFVLPKNSYKHVDFEFFAGGYIVNIEELKIERTDNVVSECTPFVTLAHDSITQKQNILLDTNFTKTNDRTIWNVFNGDIVENAYNGLSAFHYKDSRSASVTTAVEILSQKFVGKLKPSTWYTLSMFTKVKGKVIAYIGSNVTRNLNQTGKNKGADAVLCDEYIVSTSATTNTHQLEESTEYKRHSITFFTAPDLTNADERMYFYIWAQAEIYVTMLKLEECEKPTDWQLNEADRKGEKGDNGKTGKPLAGPTMWDSSVLYMSGKGDDEAYQSIVINPKYPKQMYLCGYTHTNVEPSASTSASSVDTCTAEKPWVQVPYQDFVATKVLFAERGKIENLDITNATIQGTITDMAVKTREEWDAITNALVPNADKGLTEYERNFQIVDPSKAGSYFIPTIDPTSSDNSATVYDRGPQIVFLPTYNPSTDYDIITSKITTSNTGKKRYNIPKYQIAGTHIRITKGGAPRQYLRWAYLEDAEYDRLWTSNNGNNRQTICGIYDMGTLICADHKIFKVTDGYDTHGHDMQGAWYYGDSDYKHGRFSINGTVARLLWLMPGQTVELVSQIEEIYNKKCLVWSVVNSSDFTAVNVNADLYNRSSTYEPIKFHGESSILDSANAGGSGIWEDCFMAHRKIDNLLLGGVTKELPRLFINRNGSTYDNGNPIANFYIP